MRRRVYEIVVFNIMKPRIGGHVSVAGGLVNGVENAKRIGANCIQIFASSSRQWKITWPSEESAEAFKKVKKEAGIDPVYLHAPYLINLASPVASHASLSAKTLSEYLELSDFIGANGVIFHIGSGKELPEEQALAIVVGHLKHILANHKGRSELVIENAAGGGAKIGDTLAEIGALLKGAPSERLKVCLDTAHYFEAGEIEHYDKEGVKKFAEDVRKHIGREKLVALHVNDSKTAFNSHHDRHENLGQGHIGLGGFRALAQEPLFRDTPWLLEVPGFDNEGPDRKNIDIAKKCFDIA